LEHDEHEDCRTDTKLFFPIGGVLTAEERMQYAKIAKINMGNGGYNARRTLLDLPISQRIIKAVQSATTG
jgi:hypothetical protein